VECEGAEEAQDEKEEVLQKQGVCAQLRKGREGGLMSLRDWRTGFFDARPGEIHIEEEE
jgi:hypothetical protein